MFQGKFWMEGNKEEKKVGYFYNDKHAIHDKVT